MTVNCRLTFSPVVSCAAAVPGHEEVLRVVQVRILAILDVVYDAGLEINEQGARDVVLVVGLVEEHVLPILI